ncbi:hypothetical protein Pyrfu_0540 [Pyrolobus fumarii 1A]|uniref:Uncharacterized protein n=1 Tax=Pyrolobus fumarii (strain DSM 11204 / 1A) TaxID=694429 RepID=G0EGN7_PYRF1|nr:hypothetical protein Pyrfu_0540 [Pyrolobus fumarii 1A]
MGPCTVTGAVRYRAHVVTPLTHTSENDTAQAFLAYRWAERSFRAITDPRPGSVVHLDIDLPEVPYQVGWPDIDQGGQPSSYVIDFSWLYAPYVGLGVDKTARIPGEWNTTMELIADGVVVARSYLPHCDAYPKPGVKGPMSDGRYAALARGLNLESTLSGGSSAHSGVVLYAACDDTFKLLWQGNVCTLASEEPLLEVIVPLSLPSGRVVVVPVFTYDDKDGDNKLTVRIVVEVVSPDGSVAARAVIDRPGETWGTDCTTVICLNYTSDTVVQLAPVLALDSTGGEYRLRIRAYILNPCDDTPEFSDAAAVLSKILVYRTGSLPVATFRLPLPFGHLDASTGRFEPPELYWHAAITTIDTLKSDVLLDPYIHVPGVIDRIVWLEGGAVRATPEPQASQIDARYSRAAAGYGLTISASGNAVVALPLYGNGGNPYSLSRIAVNAWLERLLWDTYSAVEPSLLVAATSESDGWAELAVRVPDGRHIIVAEFYTPITSWAKPPFVEVDTGYANPIIAARAEGMVNTSSVYTFTSGNVHRLALLVQGPATIYLRVHPGWACGGWLEGCGSLVALTHLIVMPGDEALFRVYGAPVFLHIHNIKPVASVTATLADATTGAEVFTRDVGQAAEAWFNYVPEGVPIDAVAPASHDYILYLVGVQPQG